MASRNERTEKNLYLAQTQSDSDVLYDKNTVDNDNNSDVIADDIDRDYDIYIMTYTI